MFLYSITKSDQELIQVALDKLNQCFDDHIYHHTVGAAIRCKNGKIYAGVNCDGIHGACAEFITIGIAIAAGERNFDTIVAVHEHAANGVVSPCGNCRQMLLEYAPNIKVIINNDKEEIIKVSIQDLLPFPYRKTEIID